MAEDAAVSREAFWGAVELLAHPIRREILEALLSGGPASISDLTRTIGKPWTTIAYHLDILEQDTLLRPSYEKVAHSWGHVYRVETARLEVLYGTVKRGIKAGLLQAPRK